MSDGDRILWELASKGYSRSSRRGLAELLDPPASHEPLEGAPLSLAQRGWFRPAGLAPAPVELRRTPALMRLEGPLDPAALEQALAQLRERHEILRTRYWRTGEALFQEPAQEPAPPLKIIDLSSLEAEARELELWEILRRAYAEPPRYEEGQPMTSWLFRLDEDRHVFATIIDHIALDNRSMEVILADALAIYHALTSGEPADLPPLTTTYADYARKAQPRQSVEKVAENLEWWAAKLGDIAPLDLRDPDRAPYAETSARHTLPLRFSDEARDAVYAFARQSGTTASVLLLGVLGVLLARWIRADRIAIGFVVDDRPPKLRSLAGSFVRTAPFALDLSADPTGRELMSQARAAHIEAINPERMISALEIPALRRVLVSVQKPRARLSAALVGKAPPTRAGALTQVVPRRTIKPLLDCMTLDLQIFVTEHPRLLTGRLHYAADRLDPRMAQAFARSIPAALQRIVARPDERLSVLVPVRSQ